MGEGDPSFPDSFPPRSGPLGPAPPHPTPIRGRSPPPPALRGSGAWKRRAFRFLQVEPEPLAARRRPAGGAASGRGSLAPGDASSLSPSLLGGLPPHPNPPSASEVKSCQTWRRLPALSQVLASQRKANYKNGNFQTSVQWYSNRRLGSTQAQIAFVLFCD